MAISNAYARAAQSAGRSAEKKFEMETAQLDTKLDNEDVKRKRDLYEGIVSSGLKIRDLARDFNQLGKTKQEMQFGMDMYNQLNPENQITTTKVTLGNYKELGKTIFDVRSDVMKNKEGIEFNQGDLTAIAKYTKTNKKFGAFTELLDEQLDDIRRQQKDGIL
jgi:hypothetical protein